MSTTKSEFVSLKGFTPVQEPDAPNPFDMEACKVLSVIGVGLAGGPLAAWAAYKLLGH